MHVPTHGSWQRDRTNMNLQVTSGHLGGNCSVMWGTTVAPLSHTCLAMHRELRAVLAAQTQTQRLEEGSARSCCLSWHQKGGPVSTRLWVV